MLDLDFIEGDQVVSSHMWMGVIMKQNHPCTQYDMPVVLNYMYSLIKVSQ